MLLLHARRRRAGAADSLPCGDADLLPVTHDELVPVPVPVFESEMDDVNVSIIVGVLDSDVELVNVLHIVTVACFDSDGDTLAEPETVKSRDSEDDAAGDCEPVIDVLDERVARDAVAFAEREGDAEKVRQPLTVVEKVGELPEADVLGDDDRDAEGEVESRGDVDTERLMDGDAVSDTEGFVEREPDDDAVDVRDTLMERVKVAAADGDLDALLDFEPDGEGVDVLVVDIDRVTDAEREDDCETEGVAQDETEMDEDAVSDPDGVSDALTLPVRETVDEIDAEREEDGEPEDVGVVEDVPDTDTEGVDVREADGDTRGEADGVVVLVIRGVTDAVVVDVPDGVVRGFEKERDGDDVVERDLVVAADAEVELETLLVPLVRSDADDCVDEDAVTDDERRIVGDAVEVGVCERPALKVRDGHEEADAEPELDGESESVAHVDSLARTVVDDEPAREAVSDGGVETVSVRVAAGESVPPASGVSVRAAEGGGEDDTVQVPLPTVRVGVAADEADTETDAVRLKDAESDAHTVALPHEPDAVDERDAVMERVDEDEKVFERQRDDVGDDVGELERHTLVVAERGGVLDCEGEPLAEPEYEGDAVGESDTHADGEVRGDLDDEGDPDGAFVAVTATVAVARALSEMVDDGSRVREDTSETVQHALRVDETLVVRDATRIVAVSELDAVTVDHGDLDALTEPDADLERAGDADAVAVAVLDAVAVADFVDVDERERVDDAGADRDTAGERDREAVVESERVGDVVVEDDAEKDGERDARGELEFELDALGDFEKMDAVELGVDERVTFALLCVPVVERLIDGDPDAVRVGVGFEL